MKVTKEESRPREVTLTIELDSQDVEPYLHRAYRRVVQRVNIPGFRRGKAPRSLVERYIGREGLLREALEFIVPESVNQAMKQESVDVFDQPEVELQEFDPPKIKAVVPLTPEVDLGAYGLLRIEPEEVEVTDEQVGRVLEQLRRDQAPWEPVDRPIQFGDLVTLDVEGTLEGQSIADDKGVEFIPAQNNPMPLPGFSEHLEGLPKGETKEFTLTLPEDYRDPSLASKECRFKVTIHEIKAKQLPELSDEFARSLGPDYDTLAALREKVQESLRADQERQAHAKLRDQALQQVIEGAHIEIPEMILQREADHLLHEQEEALAERRLTLEQYLQQVGKTHDEMVQELRPRAEERLKRNLVIRKVAEVENIAVADAEVDQELQAMESDQSAGQLARAFGTPQGRRSLASIILTRKVLARLEEIVTGTAEGASQETGGTAGVGSGEQVTEGGTT